MDPRTLHVPPSRLSGADPYKLHDVRLGQLLVNLSYMARSFSAEAIWDVEDEELLEAARAHLEELSSRHAPAP